VTDLDRRSFLKTGAAVAGGAAIAGPFQGFLAGGALASHGPATPGLVPTPDLADTTAPFDVFLALPPGFQYRSFQASSITNPITISDGSKLPGRHDGMGAFDGPGSDVLLVRNHEENFAGPAFGASGPVYDEMAQGGTSTVRVTLQGQVQESWASISGTQMNCSGGIMPWGSWVTCEETVNGPDVADDFNRGSLPPDTFIENTKLRQPHGFIFEVPADGTATGKPIRDAGRFAHEAVAFDASGGVLYLTEDNFGFPSGFYKYDPPNDAAKLRRINDGGKLYMAKVVGQPLAELARSHPAGTTFAIEWVQIDQPWFYHGRRKAPFMTNDEAINFVANQGLAQGAAKFSRLEGAVYDAGRIFFSSTQGGGGNPALGSPDGDGGYGNGWGQVWSYDPRTSTLELLYESPSRDVLDFPDNVTTSPSGTLILCEDHDEGNFLRGLRSDGTLVDIAHNQSSRPGDEFAGATFSPDGSTLYVNMQSSTGRSFAIWGDWAGIGV